MTGRLLYGAAFTLGMPLLLALWSARLGHHVDLPPVRSVSIGACLIVAGLALMAEAMRELWTIGGGLPMNAYPPPRFVARGVYGLVADPIYIGFVIAAAGVSIAVGSSAGFWVVTPLTALGCTALVLGYERADLHRRFRAPPRPLLSLPPDTDAPRTTGDVWTVWLLVLTPWLVLYEFVGHLPVPGARAAHFAFETQWPVLVWTEALYALVYPFVVLAPLALLSRADVRRACLRGWLGTGLGLLAYLVVPLIAPPRPFEGTGVLATMLALERADGLAGRAAFPSFHVFWAWWAAAAWAARGRRFGRPAFALAAVIVASCVTTGMHALVDLVAGTLLAAIVFADRALWRWLRRRAENVANSWHEWRLGGWRLLSHGLLAALAAAVTALVAGTLLGSGSAPIVVLLALMSLAGGALWGQHLEGSSALARPFGYYGSLVGVALGLAGLALTGADAWPAAAALAVGAPWGQAIGRLRCLMQGCCHGRAAPASTGIVVTSPHSRVVRLSALGHRPIHATPLYSLLANVVIGLLLARLWVVGPAPMVVGGYLVLTGLARFVEESYRGEPQTPIWRGLRLYQWCALASIACGMAVSTARAAPSALPVPSFDLVGLATALAIGALHLLAMGVDRPDSSRRFSRLT